MSGKRFTNEQQILLSKNPYVTKITERSITYSEEFKIHAINEYAKRRTPSLIFKEAGLEPRIIGTENPKRSLFRWRSVYFKEGTYGLKGEKRGRGSSDRPQTSDISMEECLIAAEAKIVYLQMENEVLKKLDALERGMKK